jgi:hypothetical protein
MIFWRCNISQNLLNSKGNLQKFAQIGIKITTCGKLRDFSQRLWTALFVGRRFHKIPLFVRVNCIISSENVERAQKVRVSKKHGNNETSLPPPLQTHDLAHCVIMKIFARMATLPRRPQSTMDFSPPIETMLRRLSESLFEPLGKLGRRKRRLAMIRHDREAISQWRDMRTALLDGGVTPAKFRIAVSSERGAYFMWTPAQEIGVIRLPTRSEALANARGMNYTQNATRWAQLMVLLHEWGHCLLSPTEEHGWGRALSHETRTHADPAWSQAGNYVGWCVFNEIFADAWAGAWLLKISGRDNGAVELLREMRDYRNYQAKHFDHPSFPCLHPTGRAINHVMGEEWEASSEEIFNRCLAISDRRFLEWLHRSNGRGAEACERSLVHLKLMEHHKGSPLVIWGRAWQKPGFAPCHAIKVRLENLQKDMPYHPIFTLECAKACLDSKDC